MECTLFHNKYSLIKQKVIFYKYNKLLHIIIDEGHLEVRYDP